MAELAGLALGLFAAGLWWAVWRFRVGLLPVWAGLVIFTTGWVLSIWPQWWMTPAVASVGLAGLLWFAGEHLSPHAQQLWLALVPGSLDDGRKGVLDRHTERGYLCLLVLGVGSWWAARMHYGLTQLVWYCLLGGVGLLGLPWWWHRGFRRCKPLNTWARRWKKVDQAAELKAWHGSRPTSVEGTRGAVTLTVRLRPAVTVKHVGGDALQVCSALGLRPGAVTVALDPTAARRVKVRVVPRDPWKGPILHPMPALRSIPLAKIDAVVVGRYEDGTDDLFRVSQHMLVCGATGVGKSEWLQSLLGWVLAFDHSVVVAADLASGATFDVWEGVFAHPLATNVHSAMALLTKVFALIEHRERQLAARRRAGERINVIPPSADNPWVWVIIDEFPDLIKAAQMFKDENGEKLDVITLLERIANKARKVGIWLVLGAQNPTVTDVGSTVLRGALTATVGLGLDQQQSRTLWGTLRSEGWDSEPLSQGTYLLRARNDVDHKAPRVAKGVFLTPNMRATLIDAASREPRGFGGDEAGIIGGMPAAESLGETARAGTYEVPPSAPHLRVVRDALPAPRVVDSPAPVRVSAGDTRKQELDALDVQVFAEIPDARQGGIGATAVARQVGVSRHKVNRSFNRLADEGRIKSAGDGNWCRV